MANLTTQNITGVFDTDSGRAVGIAPKGVSDPTFFLCGDALGGQLSRESLAALKKMVPVTRNRSGIYDAMIAALAIGGYVELEPVTYDLTDGGANNQPLPVFNGLRVTCPVRPRFVWGTTGFQSPDSPPASVSVGAVLQGDGTFNAFDFNSASVSAFPDPATFTNSGVTGLHFENIVFKNVKSAMKIGGTNNPGCWHSKFEALYAIGCTSWGFDLENFQHIDVKDIFSFGCKHGQRYAVSSSTSILSPGNSTFDHLYCVKPSTPTPYNRGIVFEAYGTAAELNECEVGYIQCNAGAGVINPVSATMSSASADITVPDASVFEVGLPVFFTVLNTNGFNTFKTGQTYFVIARNTTNNTIQVSDNYGGTAVTPTNGTVNSTQSVGSYGYPGIEALGWNGGAVLHSTFAHIDLESVSTTGMLIQNCRGTKFGLRNIPALGTNKGNSTVTARGATSVSIESAYEGVVLDAAQSASVVFLGSRRAAPIQHNPGWGVVREEQHGARIGLSLTEYDDCDAYALAPGLGGDVVYWRTPLQYKVMQRGNGETETAGASNFITYDGAAGGSRTLPNLTSDNHIGVTITLTNPSSGTLTWNTSGSKTFNNKAGSTALTIGANSVATVQAQKIGTTYFWAILGGSGTLTF